MLAYPGAAWRPVVNFSDVPLEEPLGLVVHVQDGDGSPWGWFNDPAAQASSHLWISAGGALEQYVSLDRVAWAEEAGNSSYISVETEGYPADPLTDAQVRRLGNLIAWGHDHFGWPVTLVDHGGRGVTTHAHYPSGEPDPSWGGHPCPGPVRTAQLGLVRTVAQLAVMRPGTITTWAPTIHDQEDDMTAARFVAQATSDQAGEGETIGKDSCWLIGPAGKQWIPSPADLTAYEKIFGPHVELSGRALAGYPTLVGGKPKP